MKTFSTVTLRAMLLLSIVVLASGFSQTAYSQLLLDENFGYPNGDSLNLIHNWTVQATASYVNPIKVTAPGLTLTDYASNSGNAAKVDTTGQDLYRSFTSQDSTKGVIYASFLINLTKTTTTGDYFLHFTESVGSFNFRGRVYAKRDASNNVAFGLGKSSEAATYTGFSYAMNTTYLVVLKYKWMIGASDTAALFVNPTVGVAEPAATIALGPSGDINTIGAINLRQGTASNAPRMTLDGLRVGSTWDEVTGIPTSPIATTGSASSVTPTGATLGGSTDPNNDSTTVTFEYGTSVSYGSSATASQSPLNGTATQSVSVTIGSLSANTAYHFRTNATNDFGTSNGDDATFTTPPEAPTADAATGATTSGFTANWTAGTGGADSYELDVSTDNGFGSFVSGYEDLSVAGTSQAVTGLAGGTTYYYRVRAVGAGGTSANSNTITAMTLAVGSNSSDVIQSPGFTYSSNIDYRQYLNEAPGGVEAFGVTVRDGGASADSDPYSTLLTSINFSVTNAANISRAELIKGVDEIGEDTDASDGFSFSGLNVLVADGGTQDLVLEIYYNTSVTDNGQNVYAVTTVTADGDSSIFAAVDGGAAASSSAGDDNRVEVTASDLEFTGNVATTTPNTNFSASTNAVDDNGNLDLDFVSSVEFSKASGPGTLTGTLAADAVAGVRSATDLQLDLGGAYSLYAMSLGLDTVTSNTFYVISPGVFKVAGSIGDTADWDSPSTWTMESGGDADGIPDGDDDVIIDNTYKSGSFVITSGVAKPDTCKSILVGGEGATSPVKVLLPRTATSPGVGSGRHGLTFGNNSPGNYDAVIAMNGTVDNAYPSQNSNRGFNILGFGAAGDSVRIDQGGAYIHRTRSSGSGIFIGMSKDVSSVGGVVEMDVPFSASTFFASGGGIVYPTLVLSANEGAATYTLSSAASSFGSCFIKGDLIVNAGATFSPGISLTGYEGDIFLRGDVVNNGTISFSSTAPNALALIGPGAQTISGNPVTIAKGILMGNSDGATLSTNVTINGGSIQTTGSFNYLQPQFPGNVFPITAAGVLNTGSATLTINSGASMNEGDNPVQGNVSATRTLNQGVNETFGSIGFEINAAGAAPGATTVTRKTGTVSTGNNNQSISRYFDVTPTTNEGLNATIGFSYATSELNGIPEANLLLHRSEDEGATWSGKSGSVNTSLHKVTATGVNAMSRWTAASVDTPLYITHTVTVRTFSDADGDINTAGDQAAKKWRMHLYSDSVSEASLVNSQNLNSGVLTTSNLAAGTYIAAAEDSSGWLRLGIIEDGTVFVTETNYDTISVAGGVDVVVDFVVQKVSSITATKAVDTDGDVNTTGDQSAKSWGLSLYSGSVAEENLVASGNAASISASNLQAGTYIAVEADSGSAWVRLGSNSTRNDTLQLSAGQDLTASFVNFRPNSVTVRRLNDADGNLETDDDRTVEEGGLSVTNADETTTYGSGSAGTLAVSNLGDASYKAKADETSSINIGMIVNGSLTETGSRTATVALSGGANATVDFIVVSEIYGQSFRTITAEALANDVDNKGKTGKSVKRAPVVVSFELTVTNTNPSSSPVNGLHMEFSHAIDTTFEFGSDPTSDAIDSKLKKWDFAFGESLDSGTTVSISGYGNKGKAQKVSKWYWTMDGVQVGEKLKEVTFVRNEPKLPMANRINVLQDAFENGGFASTGGMLVGQPRTDSAKMYAWVLHKKYGDVLKTLKDKSGMHDENPRGFDVDVKLKDLKGQKTSLGPAKHENLLLAELTVLRLNVTASAMGILPNGFGELIYDDGTSNPLNGLMVREIDSMANVAMMGYYSDGTHLFSASEDYENLADVIGAINAEFEGDLDTLSFADSLTLTGTKELLESEILHANPDVVPAKITPVRGAFTLPDVYALHQNYPNPFNPTTTIQFQLQYPSLVTLKVYNMLGQEMSTLLNREEMYEGDQQVDFNAAGFSSGVYFYRLVAESIAEADEDNEVVTPNQTFVETKKMLLVK